ncbi:MAG: 50S ribosomal protein L20 [Vulcanimicrobiaceae bacterium]
MARIKRGVHARKHHRKVMKLTKGFRGARRRNYKVANEALLHSLAYAYRDRRVRKRDFRSLWISRINAAVRKEGMSYSLFMHGLKTAGVSLNRKALAELAVSDSAAFGSLLKMAKDNAGTHGGNTTKAASA